MAGFDTLDIAVTGRGGHAAMPHGCTDSIVASGQLIGALQSVVSRALDPQLPAVLSVTQVRAGADAANGDQNPSMASADFAFVLKQAPGAYVWLGNGPVSDFGPLHTSRDDFNDAILPVGARFLAALIEGPGQ